MLKRSSIIAGILFVAFTGICFAAVYHDKADATPFSVYTQGWTDLWVYDQVTSPPANYVYKVRAEGNTTVGGGQEAWGLYLTVYNDDYTHIGTHDTPLQGKPAYLPLLTGVVDKNVNFFYTGPSSYRDMKFHADSTHYSALSDIHPSINYDLVRSEAVVTVRLYKSNSPSFAQLPEGVYMLVDEKPVRLPKYDRAELSNELSEHVQLSDATIVYADQLSALLAGEKHVDGWNSDSIKLILRQIQAFEVGELSPGDSMPIYWFDHEGESVTIGFKKLDGTLKFALVSLGR